MKFKDIWRARLTKSQGISSSAKLVGLLILGHTDDSGCGCWANQTTLACEASLGTTTVSGAVKELVAFGLIRRRPARECEDIPKNKGYILDLVLAETPSDSEGDRPSTPSESEGVSAEKPKPANSQNSNQNSNIPHHQNYHPQNLATSRSTSTSTLRDGAVGGGSTSRARAATDDLPTPSKPSKSRRGRAGGKSVAMVADSAASEQAFMTRSTPRRDPTEDETDRNALKSAIISALPDLSAEALKTAMDQNWSHLQTILDYFKLDVEAAQAWAADKVAEIHARFVREGKILKEHAVSFMLAKDSEMEAARWMSGDLRPRTAQQVPPVVAAPAMEEQTYEREPVALGEVIEQLVPQVGSGVRRVPQGAFRPKWWAGLAGELSKQSVLGEAGVDASEGHVAHLALAATLLVSAHVEVQGNVAWVRQGDIEASDLERVTSYSKDWERALSLRARQLNLAQRVRWAGNGATELAAPVEVVKEEPKAAPQVHGPRPASARPAWWAELLQQLGLWATRHQQVPDKAAIVASVRQLIPLLKDAQTAQLTGDQLTIELKSLGALRAVWPLLEPVVAEAVHLRADLPSVPSVVVVELANSTPASVEVHP